MMDGHPAGGRTQGEVSTTGHVLNGVRAKYYDIGNCLFGVPLVTSAHVELIDLQPGQNLLDIGCGTGEVLRRLRQKFDGSVGLYGVDPSHDILAVAQQKVGESDNVRIERGTGEQLRFQDESFDWVVSSLTFHHLPMATKRATVQEAHRVLKPGGSLLLSDFGKPTTLTGWLLSRIWAGHAFTREHLDDVLQGIVSEMGFTSLEVTVQGGVIHHMSAQK